MRFLPALALLLAAAACVPQPVPPPAPAPLPVPRAPPPPVASIGSDWRDWPLTPGDWTWQRDARGSVARFGVQGGDPVLTLRCDAGRRQMLLSYAAGSATPLTIRTSSVTRVLAVQMAGDAPSRVTATLAPTDSLFEAMGFSRGRFVIQQNGGATTVVPAWAEIERVTEDCRG